MTNSDDRPVLILGGGINGAALARELALQDVPVVVVDRNDLASGTTAYSSRLIHGGLRYLEFGEFDLVRESLQERGILLATASQFVRPLRFFIPVDDAWSGMWSSATRFLGMAGRTQARGRYMVQIGLALYDWFARSGPHPLPGYQIHNWPTNAAEVPCIGNPATRYVCSYSDAQMLYPERFTVSLLKDGAGYARSRKIPFHVFPYCHAELSGTTIELTSLHGHRAVPAEFTRFEPRAIVNATGAWVDGTLRRLAVPASRLIGGTKGTHFFTWQPALREALRGQAVYAQANDGRPVFVLPFGNGVLVGTTDIPCDSEPGSVVASEEELAYLLGLLNSLFPQVAMQREDISMHGCGVRPLPHVGAKTPAAITRRHQLHWHPEARMQMVSIIGGKLTTCRSLAEETARELAGRLGLTFRPGMTRERPLPAEPVLPPPDDLSGLTAETLRPFIDDEWASTLGDLVERRLMWLFHPALTRSSLQRLAATIAQCGWLPSHEQTEEIDRCCDRLKMHFGRMIS